MGLSACDYGGIGNLGGLRLGSEGGNLKANHRNCHRNRDRIGNLGWCPCDLEGKFECKSYGETVYIGGWYREGIRRQLIGMVRYS